MLTLPSTAIDDRRILNHEKKLSMRLVSLTTLAVFGVVSVAQGQKLNSKRPGVYLTFKEFVAIDLPRR